MRVSTKKGTKAENQLDRGTLEAYLVPELDNLQALLKGLNFTKSLQALLFLRQMIQVELKKMP